MEELISAEELALLDDNQTNNQLKLAQLDLMDSLSKWRLWSYLGWNDIKMRYRGSVLGPFWITASMLIFITAFSLVYSRLFHQSLAEYVPFLTAGYLVWLLIASVLTESCSSYIEAAAFITEIKLPYTMYIFRLAWRHIIIFAHNAIVYFAVALYFKVPINWTLFYVIPGLFLVMLNLTSIGLLLSILGAKYRDVTQVVTSFFQVIFFVTPISWTPSLLNRSAIIIYNPLNYFIDLVRSPLLGQVPSLTSWVVSVVLTICVFSCSFTLFARYRRNIPFWL